MEQTETLKAILEELRRMNQNIRPPAVSHTTHLTLEQVAESMNCSINTVRSWVNTGQLTAFKYKGTQRVRLESLERFIKRFTA